MVKIIQEGPDFIFDIQGLHKLWAFKSQIRILREHVIRAYQDEQELSGWKGLRAPGTHVPFLITAGTFYQSGNRIFWDVVSREHAIIIELHDEKYKKLIIEVEDPAGAIRMLTASG